MWPSEINSHGKDFLASRRRFVAGITTKSRIELDFFNLYGWLLQFVEGKKVLDAATGSGLGSFLMSHKADEVLGIDLSAETVSWASERYKLPNLKLVQGDILKDNLSQGYFDIVVSAMTLEQIDPENQLKFLQVLSSSMKEDGSMFLITPNKKVTSPFKKGGSYEWSKNEFYKNDLNRLLRSAELRPVKWFGRRRVPFFMTYFLIRKGIGFLQKISSRRFGFYALRESPVVKPINFLWQPKDFVVMIKKQR